MNTRIFALGAALALAVPASAFANDPFSGMSQGYAAGQASGGPIGGLIGGAGGALVGGIEGGAQVLGAGVGAGAQVVGSGANAVGQGAQVIAGVAPAQWPSLQSYVRQYHIPSSTSSKPVAASARIPKGVPLYVVPAEFHVHPRLLFTVVNGQIVLVDRSTRRIAQVVGPA
ncbi:DUF1236 domain-containing protein [Methylocella sp.]|uniref:DUF1236 domain-containing protein n=1 Tax=Methylocella sp. TaxID=1978226 RepID=UPI003783AF6B